MKNVAFATGSDHLSKDVHPPKKHVKTRLRARFSFLNAQQLTPSRCAQPPRLRLLTGTRLAAVAVNRAVLIWELAQINFLFGLI